jgi:hypothetical protein
MQYALGRSVALAGASSAVTRAISRAAGEPLLSMTRATPLSPAALFLSFVFVLLCPAGRASNAFESDAVPPPTSSIDQLVLARLQHLGLEPSPLCSDAVFVRRVFLDVIGTLPTAAETRQFLQDRTPDKRRRLIDRLLAREEFADYWATKWSDLLRIKAEFPINLWPNAAQA